MKIICINGFPESGKSKFVAYCKQYLDNHGFSTSSVDFVKDIARDCGWDGSKTPKNRKFLSDLKDLLVEWNDVPFKKVNEEIIHFLSPFKVVKQEDKVVVFVDVREPYELQKYKERLNAKCLLISRATVEKNRQSNHADNDVLNFEYDYVITNDGTEEDLQEKAKSFIINIEKENWESRLEG